MISRKASSSVRKPQRPETVSRVEECSVTLALKFRYTRLRAHGKGLIWYMEPSMLQGRMLGVGVVCSTDVLEVVKTEVVLCGACVRYVCVCVFECHKKRERMNKHKEDKR